MCSVRCTDPLGGGGVSSRAPGATTFGLDSLRDSDVRWLPREHPSVSAVHRRFAEHTRTANEDGWGWPLTRPETKGLQFAKYEEPHGGYDWHVDAVPQRDRKGGGQMVTRMVTLVAQLSPPDSYTGGDLQVGTVNVSRQRGTLHVFPSSMAHKVWPTTAGKRWSVVSWNGGVLESAPDYFETAIDSYKHMLAASADETEGSIAAVTAAPSIETISHWKKLLARTYTFVGKLDDAEAAFEEATLLTPEDLGSYNNLGMCRVQQVNACKVCFNPQQLYHSKQVARFGPGQAQRGGHTVRARSSAGS
eukprot:COSAG02_NODE_5680_length_4131_cov_4.013641_6_plen_304_part_00